MLQALHYDDPGIEEGEVRDKHMHLFTPIHVQDGATSCADVADDHRGWKDRPSMLRNQRHVDVELLKIFHNKTTDKKMFTFAVRRKNA